MRFQLCIYVLYVQLSGPFFFFLGKSSFTLGRFCCYKKPSMLPNFPILIICNVLGIFQVMVVLRRGTPRVPADDVVSYVGAPVPVTLFGTCGKC